MDKGENFRPTASKTATLSDVGHGRRSGAERLGPVSGLRALSTRDLHCEA